MSEEDECKICVQKYTLNKRFKFSCNACDNSCCVECFKKNLMTDLNFKCMFCEKIYQIQDLYVIVKNKLFMSNLLNEISEKKIEDEKALFPSTQEAVRQEIKFRKYNKFRKIGELKIHELKSQMLVIRQQINEYYYLTLNQKIAAKEFTFIKECSYSECTGYLDKNWNCGLCDLKTCSKCHSPSRIDHVCDEGAVESLALIKKDTKPCPKCGQGINKSSGCNQMFCTSCKFVFDWVTGREEKSVHNPHYFEYMRTINNGQIPRQAGDIPGGCVNNFITTMTGADRYFSNFLTTHKFDRKTTTEIMGYFQIYHHLNRYEAAKYTKDYDDIKKKMRVRVLMGDLDKDKWKSELKRTIKNQMVNEELLKLISFISIVIDSGVANIFKLMEDKIVDGYLEEIATVNTAVEYGNTKLLDISKIFSVKAKKFIIARERFYVSMKLV